MSSVAVDKVLSCGYATGVFERGWAPFVDLNDSDTNAVLSARVLYISAMLL